MKKKLWVVLFVLPLVCFACWAVWLYVLSVSGKEVTLAVKGYDPRDLLSGRYIAYQIDWEKTNCGQFEGGICPENEFCVEAKWGRACRFYVPEKSAMYLENMLQNASTDANTFEVVFAYQKGRTPIAKRFLISGKDWHAIVE